MFKNKKILFYSIHAVRLVMFCLLLLLGLLVVIFHVITHSHTAGGVETGRLAIVIDDFGLQRKGVDAMLSLDCKLTVAVMPFLEYSEDDAENALENGKEVIVHIPMQATLHDRPSHLGPRPIRVGDSPEVIRQWMEDALCELPEAQGANIHMGTLCSTRECVMKPILQLLQERNLYFIDSKTSSESVCRQTARKTGVRYYENEVFLEHESKTKEYVKKCLRKAMKLAKTEGSCIAIGHVGCEGGMITVEAIREMLPEFRENRVELVFVSELSPFFE